MSEPRLLDKEELERLHRDYPVGAIRGEIHALFDHIAALEQSLEHARKERDQHKQSAEAWRKRAEQAAEALADVLPGEVGRLDLLARIAELKRQSDEWQRRAESLLNQAEGFEADLSRLKPSGQVAEDQALALRMIWPVNGDHGGAQIARTAITRLAAGAQGYEAMLGAERARDELFDTISRLLGQRPEEDTLSAVERVVSERDAAVADNAALLESLSDADHDDECQFLQMCAQLSGVALGLPVGLPVPVSVCDCFKSAEHQPHPGAELLEQHRKEVDALASRIAAMDTEARAAKEALGAIWAVVGGMSDPASIAKSVTKKIAQARNEGLEKMSKWADEQEARAQAHPLGETIHGGPLDGASRYNIAMECVRAVRAAVAAMKEPEQ